MPAHAANWEGYEQVFENRKITLYAKIHNYMAGYGGEQEHTRVDWRVVNHTNSYIRVEFTARYNRKSGEQTSKLGGSKFGRSGTFAPGEDAGNLMRVELYGDHVTGISGVFELKIKEGRTIEDLDD